MKIILLKSHENLGNVGDIVNVKPGYARNYLFPMKLLQLLLNQMKKARFIFKSTRIKRS